MQSQVLFTRVVLELFLNFNGTSHFRGCYFEAQPIGVLFTLALHQSLDVWEFHVAETKSRPRTRCRFVVAFEWIQTFVVRQRFTADIHLGPAHGVITQLKNHFHLTLWTRSRLQNERKKLVKKLCWGAWLQDCNELRINHANLCLCWCNGFARSFLRIFGNKLPSMHLLERSLMRSRCFSAIFVTISPNHDVSQGD